MDAETPAEKEPWWSRTLMEWCAKIGVPAVIAFTLLFLQGRKLDDISGKLSHLITITERNGK